MVLLIKHQKLHQIKEETIVMGLLDFLLKPKIKKYDLDSVDGIESIEVPAYRKNNGIQSPVNNIEYILQRKATEHKKNGRMDLAIACLRKSNQIFPYSNFAWTNKDYMRLVEFLKQAGRFDEAREEERKINSLFESDDSCLCEFEYLLQECSNFNTDLVISSEISRACSECAKYAKRVFSLSGNDNRFPQLPKYFREDLPEHAYCFNSFYPFVLGTSEPDWNYRGTIIDWSNRPFVDKRTKSQKTEYKNWVVENEQEAIDRKNYDFLREFFPDIVPKSFGGFRRMKSAQSYNYKKLLDNALTKGVNLNESPDLSIFRF